MSKTHWSEVCSKRCGLGAAPTWQEGANVGHEVEVGFPGVAPAHGLQHPGVSTLSGQVDLLADVVPVLDHLQHLCKGRKCGALHDHHHVIQYANSCINY